MKHRKPDPHCYHKPLAWVAAAALTALVLLLLILAPCAIAEAVCTAWGV